jgi:hypothetical protein
MKHFTYILNTENHIAFKNGNVSNENEQKLYFN